MQKLQNCEERTTMIEMLRVFRGLLGWRALRSRSRSRNSRSNKAQPPSLISPEQVMLVQSKSTVSSPEARAELIHADLPPSG
jgi:hypothetical protein